jgi:hypothetical protein
MTSIRYLRERIRPWYLRRIYFSLHPESKPMYFDSCWSFPDYRRDIEKKGETKGVSVEPVALFLPMNDWHTRTQRTQHLAQVLSRRGYRCLYLNPHLGREFPAARRRGDTERLKVLDRNLFELHVHLPLEPVFHHRRLVPSEIDLLSGAIVRALELLEPRRVVQILAFPVWWEVARWIRERYQAPIIYDCHDYLPGFAGVAREITEIEPELFQRSDRVLCSSQALMARARGLGAPETRCALLRNAAAAEFFDTVRMPAGSATTIGYVGALDAWFDAASVEWAARAHPEWRFELIGRVENPRIDALRTLPNVHLAGEVRFDTLPSLLATFRVGIIPFLISPLIEATDPIKAYEYLAAGLPVVSSRLPEIERFGDLVSCYTGPADFVTALEAALANDSDALTARRRQAALGETWERRGEELSRAIQSLG